MATSDLGNDLSEIQRKLKAPKGQFNAFGKYKYRSCEDIVEAIKPLLKEGVSLILTDDIVLIGDRYYIKATASITNGVDSVKAFGWAREPSDKKGMDPSQVTGATSSYARKYALNGLFAIDDTKDADTTNTHNAESVNSQLEENFNAADYVMPVGLPSIKGRKLSELSVEEIKNQLNYWKPKATSGKPKEAVAAMELYLADNQKLPR